MCFSVFVGTFEGVRELLRYLEAVCHSGALLNFFGLVPGSLKRFFPPRRRCFFPPLPFTFHLLRRCYWPGPCWYHSSPVWFFDVFCLAWPALQPDVSRRGMSTGFFQHWGVGFWLQKCWTMLKRPWWESFRVQDSGDFDDFAWLIWLISNS